MGVALCSTDDAFYPNTNHQTRPATLATATAATATTTTLSTLSSPESSFASASSIRPESSMSTPSASSGTIEPEPGFPVMDLRLVALSLRWTCETNRRLRETSRLSPSTHDRDYQDSFVAKTVQTATAGGPGDPLGVQRGGNMVHVHPSQQWQPPIRSRTSSRNHHTVARGPSGRLVYVESDNTKLTLFHAKSPRTASGKKQRRGAARWGPDLHLYLQHLTRLLNVQDDPLVMGLAILYLDRACSVETPRSDGTKPCPYVSPRTVHRLILTSLLIATRAVSPTPVDTASLEASLGIPKEQLDQMEYWMEVALGDAGLYVTQDQLRDFFHKWERRWTNSGKGASKIRSKTTQTASHEPERQQTTSKRNLIRPVGANGSSDVNTAVPPPNGVVQSTMVAVAVVEGVPAAPLMQPHRRTTQPSVTLLCRVGRLKKRNLIERKNR